MSAVFILSFDCEGKWGIADRITPFIESHFTNERLNEAYASILGLLERYRIFASFAFVGAFTLSEQEYLSRRDWFESDDPWLHHFHRDAQGRAYDGWLNPRALEMVADTPGHEIASHGFTHRPLSESMATLSQMRTELSYLRRLSTFEDAATFIYPRNLVGYPNALRESGFKGYRAGVKEVRNSRQRAFSLLQEVNLFAKSQRLTTFDDLVQIPSGHIINWRRGLRKAVPIAVSLMRIQRMLSDAIQNHQVVHLWSHPHNFVTGSNMYPFFEEILKMAAKEREAGRLEILTQAQYVANVSVPSRDVKPVPGREVVAR